MSIFSIFSPKGKAKGTVITTETGAVSGEGRIVEDNRIPIYIIYILDTSGSMSGIAVIKSETGEIIKITKIEQLNIAIKKIINTLKNFESENPLYRVYVQFIELNSYGKAVFPTFQSLSRGFEEICFQADGCTELRASLNTLKEFINDKHLKDERTGKGTNRAVSVILMSDGHPTDCNGIEHDAPAYKSVIDDSNAYFREMGYARNMDFYSIAVGADANEEVLRYFCGSSGGSEEEKKKRFYLVEDSESLIDVLDLATRATLQHHTTLPIFTGDNDEDPLDTDTDTKNKSGSGTDSGNTDGTAITKGSVTETDKTLDGLFDGIE